MAKTYGVCLVAGTLPIAVPGVASRVRNTTLVYSAQGHCVARYDKIHLFDVDLPDGNTYRESATVQPGDQLPPVVDVPGLGRIGLSICYDVRFPELYRHLAQAGADVLFVPAAFTAFTGKDHWQVLLQARAIENTAYVVAPAQTGQHYGRRQSHGHALVIDPWGTVLADAGVSVSAAIAPIDPGHAQRVRAQMPSLRHRRPNLF
jgi:nitrilase